MLRVGQALPQRGRFASAWRHSKSVAWHYRAADRARFRNNVWLAESCRGPIHASRRESMRWPPLRDCMLCPRLARASGSTLPSRITFSATSASWAEGRHGWGDIGSIVARSRTGMQPGRCLRPRCARRRTSGIAYVSSPRSYSTWSLFSRTCVRPDRSSILEMNDVGGRRQRRREALE